jgi:kynurenine formamidase|tara:strand:- start:6 stop:1085 length:1080 start_codon:yes stop_codon:yes gene_type:complete
MLASQKMALPQTGGGAVDNANQRRPRRRDNSDQGGQSMKSASLLASAAAAAFGLGLFVAGPLAAAGTFVVDLTHPIGTFSPKDGNIGKPDLTKPLKGSIQVPTFGAQAVYEALPDFKTNRGYFGMGRFLLYEHHGTHIDAPVHFNNTDKTLESKNPDKRTLEELGVDDLTGPVVFIDISSRVQAELDKNGGKPGKSSVTDFGNNTSNVVTAADIAGVEAQIRSGIWLVVNAGWSRFFKGTSLQDSPYINGWNFPGMSQAACDKLIEIEDRKGVRINGIAMDNIGIDSGENSRGPKGDLVTDSWHCHMRGLQRGWKFLENGANLGQLAEAKPGSCMLFVGAPKLVGGTGGPSRAMALCER